MKDWIMIIKDRTEKCAQVSNDNKHCVGCIYFYKLLYSKEALAQDFFDSLQNKEYVFIT